MLPHTDGNILRNGIASLCHKTLDLGTQIADWLQKIKILVDEICIYQSGVSYAGWKKIKIIHHYKNNWMMSNTLHY